MRLSVDGVPARVTDCYPNFVPCRCSAFSPIGALCQGRRRKNPKMKTYLSKFGARKLVPLAVTAGLVAPGLMQASTDYGPAIWKWVACNYSTSGYGHSFVVIHDME